MPLGQRGSEWATLRRGLLIVQRLLQGPANAGVLMDYVLAQDPSAYPEAQSARERAFKRDRENLRSMLGVQYEYDSRANQYALVEAGPYFSMTLSERSMRGLAVISETFAGQAGEHSEIQALVEELIGRMPESARRTLDAASQPVNLEIFQQVDPNGIPTRVWQTVQRATRERRKLTFNYLSPSNADGLPRLHEVAPVKIVYQWGHWYLRGWAENLAKVDGVIFNPQGEYLRYRLSYIQNNETLSLSPRKITHLPTPPRYRVEYRLLPPLSRGAISRHFEEMTVTPQADGSVVIRGWTEDEWEAGRLLLAYGEFCEVLGGDEVYRRVRRAAEGMAKLYQVDDRI